jgi:sigma-B regulation protein RsbU (phosphoserine phosphatase)
VDDPAELMERVNRLIYDASASNRYATLFYAQYEPEGRRLSYVNAGHNPPIVLRKRNGSFQVLRLETGGPVVGLLPHRYQLGVFAYEAGDVVLLFTDGVTESMNIRLEEWGEDRLIEVAKMYHGSPVTETMRRILSAAEGFAGGAPQHDDMTLVVLRVV